MQIGTTAKLAIFAGITLTAAATLAACGGPKGQGGGPDADLTNEFMKDLHPDSIRGVKQLSLATDSTHVYQDEDGRVTGTMDGTRLLKAADSHAFGTPTITDPLVDKQDDGFATFNEIRHVVSHFDVDGSGGFDGEEGRAFQDAVGIRWIGAE